MSAFKLLICSVCIGPPITMPVTWLVLVPVEGMVLGMAHGWPLTMRTWWMWLVEVCSADVNLVVSMTGLWSSCGAAIIGGGGAGAMGTLLWVAGFGRTWEIKRVELDCELWCTHTSHYSEFLWYRSCLRRSHAFNDHHANVLVPGKANQRALISKSIVRKSRNPPSPLTDRTNANHFLRI